MAEEKKREINKLVKDQKCQEKLNGARDNLSIVKGEAASLKDLIDKNPTLAFKNLTEYVQSLDKTLCEAQGTFFEFDTRFADADTMLEVVQRRFPMLEKQSINTAKVRNIVL